jgi:hypothetical protein
VASANIAAEKLPNPGTRANRRVPIHYSREGQPVATAVVIGI